MITGAIISNNALLVREDLLARLTAAERATYNLQIMHHNGELEVPGPWVNDMGEKVVAWSEQDGNALECYLDMLGLNGRQPTDSMTWNSREHRRRTKANKEQGR